jgi:hypothetical protein
MLAWSFRGVEITTTTTIFPYSVECLQFREGDTKRERTRNLSAVPETWPFTNLAANIIKRINSLCSDDLERPSDVRCGVRLSDRIGNAIHEIDQRYQWPVAKYRLRLRWESLLQDDKMPQSGGAVRLSMPSRQVNAFFRDSLARNRCILCQLPIANWELSYCNGWTCN